MSENTRTRNSSKSGGGKTQTRKSSAPKNTYNPLLDEVIVLLSLAIAIVLLLSNFNIAGTFGQKIAYFTFGMFGLTQYIMPVLFFVLVLFVVANKNNNIARIKAVAAVFTMMFTCTLFQLFFFKRIPASESVGTIFTECAKHRIGGGFVGSIFYKIFSPFGVIASFILVIIFIIISLVIVTEHSFISGVKSGSAKIYHKTRDGIEAYNEEAMKKHEENVRRAEERMARRAEEKEEQKRAREEEETAKRVQKKKRGVTNNTEFVQTEMDTLDIAPVDNSSDMKEIFAPGEVEAIHDVSERISAITKEDAKQDSFKKVEPTKTVKATETKASEPAASASHQAPVKSTPVKESHVEPNVDEEIHIEVKPESDAGYVFPPVTLLAKASDSKSGGPSSELEETKHKLTQVLQNFGVKATVTNATQGPTVTRYELTPETGVKVSKIVSLADDIKLNLAATDIRIEAPIPGKSAVGIEVPNQEKSSVMFRELIESSAFKNHSSNICFGLGKDIGGNVIVSDLAKMPHLLIAGQTGSGKSVCVNTIIMSILFRANPNDVKLIMIDPKVVELKVYNGIPHLLTPVVTDPKKAAGALNWAVAEMDDRYRKFAEAGVRDLKGYNSKIDTLEGVDEEAKPTKLPQIVIVVDEMAELMMAAKNEVETAIVRLAQLARAAGIHLIVATQRPTTDVITGLIKANVPSKIAFSVSTGIDSRIVIDRPGAEKLLGRGDMLYFPSEYPNPVRLQGAYVSDEEVQAVVDFIKEHSQDVTYSESVTNHIETPSMADSQAFGGERDALFEQAGRFIIEKEKASIGMIQRMYKVGFNRAARIMDQLTDAGVVGPEEGTKPRKILMTIEQFEEII